MTIQLHRLPNWQQRLDAFVRSKRAEPFAWGQNDCCTFAAGAVEAVTGVDLAAHFGGGRPVRESLRFLREHGGVCGLATEVLGEPVSRARVGDVVLFFAGRREALGVSGGGVILAPGPTGIVTMHRRKAVFAWRVG